MKTFNVLRRGLTLTLGLIILLLIPGCWSSVELNERAFVKMMILDKTEEGIELTLGFPLPNRTIPGTTGGSGNASGKPYTFITKSGNSVSQAYRKIQSDISRIITFGQTRIVVIGRELAEEGIDSAMDFVAREPQFHINANVFVTEGRSKVITSIPAIFERYPSDILSAYSKQNVIIDTTVKDILMENYGEGDFVAPLLVFGKENIVSEKGEQTWMGTDGAALFAQGKMVGALNTKEMRGGLWISGKLKDAEISIQSPTDGRDISFMVRGTHTKVKPEITKKHIKIQIRSKADVEVLSSNSNIDLNNLSQLRMLEQSLGTVVRGRMTETIDGTKRVHSDAFHLGNFIDWRYPNKWKLIRHNWRELYAEDVEFDIHVNISIQRLGTIQHNKRALQNMGVME